MGTFCSYKQAFFVCFGKSHTAHNADGIFLFSFIFERKRETDKSPASISLLPLNGRCKNSSSSAVFSPAVNVFLSKHFKRRRLLSCLLLPLKKVQIGRPRWNMTQTWMAPSPVSLWVNSRPFFGLWCCLWLNRKRMVVVVSFFFFSSSFFSPPF